MIWWFFSFGYTIFPLEGRLSWQVEKSNWWIYVAIVGGKFSTFLHVRKFSSLKCRRQDKLLLNNLECLNFLASMWASLLCFFACEWYSLAFVSLGSSTVKCMISICLCSWASIVITLFKSRCMCEVEEAFQLLSLSLSQNVCVK